MTTLHATNIYVADGATTDYSFNFEGVQPGDTSGTKPYLYPADVRAAEIYVDENGVEITVERECTLLTPSSVRIAGLPIAASRRVKIYRRTEIRFPLVDYRDRQTVSELDLDLQARQDIFLAAELEDQITLNGVRLSTLEGLINTAIIDSAEALAIATDAQIHALVAESTAAAANALAEETNTLVQDILASVEEGPMQSFNGRAGHVVPLYGDYNAAKIPFAKKATGATDGTMQEFSDRFVHFDDFKLAIDVDDTAGFDRAFAYLLTKLAGGLQTVDGVSSAYAAAVPKLRLPPRVLTISGTPTSIPPYLNIEGEDTLIVAPSTVDILSGEGYMWRIAGVKFIGGKKQINVFNANTNGAMIDFVHCEFHLAKEFCFYTYSTHATWNHLSTNFSVRYSKLLNNAQVAYSVCDQFAVDNCWVQQTKTRMLANTAAFINSRLDQTGHAVMVFNKMFGVPSMGVQGVDRIPGVAWIHNFSSFLSRDCRYGGEDAGIPIVVHLQPMERVNNKVGFMVSILGGWCYAGSSVGPDSGILSCKGGVPQNIIMEGVMGPVGVPYIISGGLDIDAHIAAWEAATTFKAYRYININIRGMGGQNVDGVGNARIPQQLRKYMSNGRHTQLQCNTIPNIPNAFVTFNPVLTVIEDTLGAFDPADNIRIVMPFTANRLLVIVRGDIENHVVGGGADTGAPKTIEVGLFNEGGTWAGGDTILHGTNPNTDRFSYSAVLKGTPNSKWTTRIRHNAAGVLRLLSYEIDVIPLDYLP